MHRRVHGFAGHVGHVEGVGADGARSARPRRPLAAWLLLAPLSIACGRGGGQDPEPPPDAGRDGRAEDAAPDDAMSDAAREDAAVDGSVEEDASAPAWDCPMVGDGAVRSWPASQQQAPVVATAPDSEGMHLLYTAAACQQGSRAGQGLRYLRVPSGGEIEDPAPVANVGDSCERTRAPSVVATSPTRARAYFAASNVSPLELYTRALPPEEGAEPAPGERLTFDEEALPLWEYATAAFSLGARDLVVFAVEHGSSQRRGIFSLPRDTPAAVSTLLPLSDDHRPVALAASPLHGEEAPAVVAWLGSDAEGQGLLVLPLDDHGAALGEPERFETVVGSGATLDIAQREDGTAIAYTVGPDGTAVRLLLLNEAGRARRAPVALTHPSERASDVGIAPYGTGYVVAYRFVVSASDARLRLSFVDLHGLLAGSRDVAEASQSGGRVGVEVASDGRILLAWPDATEAGTQLRVARVECD